MQTGRAFGTWALTSLGVFLLAAPGVLWGRTLYVDDNAAGAQDGSSWTRAFTYLQDALAVAKSGDEIHVAQGEYRPDRGGGNTAGDRNATFQVPDGVTIQGGFAGVGAADPNLRDVALFAAILTGDLAGNDDLNDQSTLSDNSLHVVTAEGAGSDTMLDGLTITHGYADDQHGAALCHEGGSLVVCDCTFRDNGAEDGDAGAYNHKGNLRLEHCRFTGNWADDHSASLRNDQGSVQVIASEFVENHSSTNEGGANVGAVTCTGGHTEIAHCLFSGNTGELVRGLWVVSGSVFLKQCTFYGDITTDSGHAGAVYGLSAHCVTPASCLSTNALTAHGCIFRAKRALATSRPIW
jgi:hypothetical protein